MQDEWGEKHMQPNITVVIVEDDPSVCRSFAECFEKTDGITLVKTTASVPDALTYVREHRPDAVILDLELHKGVGNGISFLTALRQMPAAVRPYVLVNTNNSSQTTYDMVRALGAGFVMYKHQEGYSPEGVAEILLAMSVLHQSGLPPSAAPANRTPLNEAPVSSEEKEKQLTRRICAALDSVSISPKAVGYRYLIEAIAHRIQRGTRHAKRHQQSMDKRGYEQDDCQLHRPHPFQKRGSHRDRIHLLFCQQNQKRKLTAAARFVNKATETNKKCIPKTNLQRFNKVIY